MRNDSDVLVWCGKIKIFPSETLSVPYIYVGRTMEEDVLGLVVVLSEGGEMWQNLQNFLVT